MYVSGKRIAPPSVKIPPPTKSGSPSTTVIGFVAAMLDISSSPQKTATSTAYVALGAVANDVAEAASRG